eukprot:TRINITY_DN3478_c0_g1_i2.p1 TRINITY_DN3478_c0_g1~~TRINITY_DN3478_c0_g1_i2.p1  ORF type:complete len:102 (-),score=18.99 TRINITY_DN3478_c0_g1_i2:451-756(-)
MAASSQDSGTVSVCSLASSVEGEEEGSNPALASNSRNNLMSVSDSLELGEPVEALRQDRSQGSTHFSFPPLHPQPGLHNQHSAPLNRGSTNSLTYQSQHPK